MPLKAWSFNTDYTSCEDDMAKILSDVPSKAVMRLEQFPDGFLHVFMQLAPQGL